MAKQGVTVELFYSGDWQDHTDAALIRDQIGITRGRADESQQPAPATATLTFNSWDFNPRNPASPLHGLIGRNTPLRISVGGQLRFVGEVSSWTPRQSLGGDVNVPDRWVEVVAADLTRRLGQGADPLHDTWRRFVQANTAQLVGYWPMSDVDGSTSAASVIRGTRMRISDQTELPGFDTLPSFGAQLLPWLPTGIETGEDGAIEAQVSGATTPEFAVDFIFRATKAAGGNIPVTSAVSALTATPQNFQVLIDPGLLPRVQVIDDDGSTLAVLNGDPHPEIFDGLPHHFRLQVFDSSGNNVTVRLDLDGQQILGAFVDIEQAALEPLAKLLLFWQAGGIGVLPVRFGQITAWNDPPLIGDMYDAYLGHVGEHAGRRIERLCDEEAVPFVAAVGSDLDDTQPAGPQYPGTLLELLQESAGVDLGTVYDARVDTPTLNYRPGRDLYNQVAALPLDYAAGQVAPALDPVVDDQQTRNDVTATRRDGGEARAVDEAGPLGVDTVGRYATSVDLNAMADGLLGDQAGWRLHLGTSDETRFPQITVDLDATPGLVTAVAATDVGDRITIDNLPPALSPDLASLLVQGWTETVGSHTRRVTFNCTPEEPYHIAEVEHADYAVIGSAAATLLFAADATVDNLDVALGAGPAWVHEVDYDIAVGGERMTVTGVFGAGGTFPDQSQTVLVTRSVNGVVKSHPIGAPVDVFHRSYIGL